MNKQVTIFSIATILLVVGTGIYFFFREPILFFLCLNIASNRIVICNIDNPLSYFFLFCLPDALWYMSLLLLQTYFLIGKGLLNRLFVIIAIILPFLLEVFQYFDIMSGTFDWYDILTYCLTLMFYLLCLKKLFLPLHYKS